MVWLVLVATVAYSLFLVAISRASLFTDSNLVAAIVNALGTFVPLGLFMVSGAALDGSNNAKGIVWAIIGGIGVAAFIMALARIFSIGGNVGFVTPLVYGGSIIIATTVGGLVYREPISPWQVIGLLFVTAGIGCIVYARYRQGFVH